MQTGSEIVTLFQKSQVNTSRQPEVDLAKVICLIGMIFVHSFEMATSFKDPSGGIAYLFVIVLDSIFGAATFMFCMGIGIAYSRRTSPQYLMTRGLKLLIVAYALNLVRSMPQYITDFSQFLGDLCSLDILQFAGLALILFGFLKYIKLPDWGIAIAALVLSVISTLAGQIECKHLATDLSLGLFLPTYYNEQLYGVFPLFGWFVFVVAGYYFGLLLRRCYNKKKLYAALSLPSAAVIAVYMAFAIPHRRGMMGSIINYFHMQTYNAVICICGALLALGLYYLISLALPQVFKNFICRMSRNINAVYCVQWVAIAYAFYGVTAFAPDYSLSDGVIMVSAAVIVIISFILADIYYKIKNNFSASKTEGKHNADN